MRHADGVGQAVQHHADAVADQQQVADARRGSRPSARCRRSGRRAASPPLRAVMSGAVEPADASLRRWADMPQNLPDERGPGRSPRRPRASAPASQIAWMSTASPSAPGRSARSLWATCCVDGQSLDALAIACSCRDAPSPGSARRRSTPPSDAHGADHAAGARSSRGPAARTTRSANRSASRQAPASRRTSARARTRNCVSAIDLPPLAAVAVRRKSRPEFIQTTFDMGFDRSKWRIQGRRRLGVRKTRAVAERNAHPLRLATGLQRLVQIDPRVGAGPRRRQFGRVQLGRLGQQVGPRLAPPALDVEPGGDALTQARNVPSPRNSAICSNAARKASCATSSASRAVGAHAPQQAAHRRAVPAHQFAERGAVAGRAPARRGRGRGRWPAVAASEVLARWPWPSRSLPSVSPEVWFRAVGGDLRPARYKSR